MFTVASSELWDISDTFASNSGIDLGNLLGTLVASPVQA
jgi:hypothetical protein